MTDRELLEFAAKAAGIELTYCPVWGCMAKKVYDLNREYFDGFTCWNPLIDDGDALRLAGKLSLSASISQFGAVAGLQFGNYIYEECVDNNPYAATRRAIVRAAAEIGRSMK